MDVFKAKLVVLDPSAGAVEARAGLSPRVGTLAGKTLGVIWNGRPAGNQILYRVVDTLKEKHGVQEVLFRDKPWLGNIAPNEILDELTARCDAVVTGVGD